MNTRLVTKKIKSVSNVKKITKAMQLVSAVKMRKAQQVAQEGKPYQEFLQQAIHRLASGISTQDNPLLNPGTANKKNLVIVFTSQKGLCGSFNMNILRYLVKHNVLGESDFVTIGKKGVEVLTQLKASIVADYSGLADDDTISAVFELALQKFLNGEYKNVFVAYNKFVNTLRSDPSMDRVLPFAVESLETKEVKEALKENEYLIEPRSPQLIDELLKSYIESTLRFALLQSYAGEHSARMIAMKNATDNASEVILNLTSLRNKLRQQSITYELLDMITAKESVEIN